MNVGYGPSSILRHLHLLAARQATCGSGSGKVPALSTTPLANCVHDPVWQDGDQARSEGDARLPRGLRPQGERRRVRLPLHGLFSSVSPTCAGRLLLLARGRPDRGVGTSWPAHTRVCRPLCRVSVLYISSICWCLYVNGYSYLAQSLWNYVLVL